MAPSARRLKVGVAGLGRMGKRHATNFLSRTPRAELVAVFTPDPNELKYAREELVPYGVTVYDDYDKMIAHEGLEAVVIATATSVHAEESIAAMEKNLHVLCEKPLSTQLDIVSSSSSACHQVSRPRRFTRTQAPIERCIFVFLPLPSSLQLVLQLVLVPELPLTISIVPKSR